jgi:hypothetical protein
MKFAILIALVFLTTIPCASAAEPHDFAKNLTFEGQAFALTETGTMKARALVGSVTIFEFAKYATSDQQQNPDQRLLVLRLTRALSANQLQQVFRGVVRSRTGYSDAQLQTFLALLPAAASGSTLRLRSGAHGNLDVFVGDTLAGSVDAQQLAVAVWAGFSGDKVSAHR